MSRDAGAPRVRERVELTVFDHSGDQPRPVRRVEVVAVNGRVVSVADQDLASTEGPAAVEEGSSCRSSG